jgi:hypothetical protein
MWKNTCGPDLIWNKSTRFSNKFRSSSVDVLYSKKNSDIQIFRCVVGDRNIAGLQLADLITYPSFRAMLAHNENQPLPDNFGGKIGIILETSKYVRGSDGQIDTWGREWLP